MSPAYEKARSKNPLLPAVTDRVSAENVFKLLPISILALRVSKLDPNANPAHGQPGHQHGGGKAKTKDGKKALWSVKIEPQQEAADDFYYIWFYEGAQWRQKLYAGGALFGVMAVVLFPLWPYTLRKGVWYLSMGCVGLLGLFFALAIVRLIMFLVTIVTGPKPGIWLFPNLFEDVGFFDSFKPLWAWREVRHFPGTFAGTVFLTSRARHQNLEPHSKRKRKQSAQPKRTSVLASRLMMENPTAKASKTERLYLLILQRLALQVMRLPRQGPTPELAGCRRGLYGRKLKMLEMMTSRTEECSCRICFPASGLFVDHLNQEALWHNSPAFHNTRFLVVAT